MGNTCAPNRGEDEQIAIDNENMDDAQPSMKLAKVINTYQAEFETLKMEVEALRNQGDEDNKSADMQAQNDEIMKELSAVKAKLQMKEQALVKHQLEAALHSKATSMINTGATTKIMKAGGIEKFGRAGKSKARPKWVELNFHSAEATEGGIIQGYLMLTYTNSKDSQLSNRCRVVRLHDGGRNEDSTFSAIVVMSGSEREVVFVCKDDITRESWVQAFNDGFNEIEMELNSHKAVNEYTVIEVQFSQETLGIRVEERFEAKTEGDDVESKAQEVSSSKLPAGEQSCDLVVTAVNDESLYSSGLAVGYIVGGINGKNLRGMTYKQQIGHLNSTKKPFTLTFLKKKVVEQIAHPDILEDLVADGDNMAKFAFYDLVEGSQFGMELGRSDNKAATITEFLANQRRLASVLQLTRVH